MNKKILIFCFAIFLIAGIFASYTLENPKYFIKEKYSKGENIQGWVNLSFQDEPTNSVFSDSFGNSITLINLLETDKNSGINYTCNPVNCQLSYNKLNPSAQKQISFNAGEEKLIGFVINDNIDKIADFKLTITSDAIKSDENQLKIDLFNDGTNDIGNTKVYAQTEEWSAPKDYSCFDYTDPQVKDGGIKSGDIYCQRINLPEAPGFSFGAWLKKESSSDVLNLKMNLYDIELEEKVAECALPVVSDIENPVYCDVNYLVTKQKDYYVCLSAESGTGTYKMKIYGYTNDRCGFMDIPPAEEIAAYRMFSQPRFFDAIGTLEISNTLPAGDFISEQMEFYIEEKYDDLNCAGKNCIIPIKLISNVQQTVAISGQIEYSSPYSSGLEEKNIYDLSENSAKITADRQKIFLDDADFIVPNDIGQHEFKLFLENSELFEKQIEVKKGIEILSINPFKTAAGLSTNFKVKVNAGDAIISKYNWDFNSDGIIDETTLTNSVQQIYPTTGDYNLIISVEDSEGTSSSESFSIVVGSAKDVLDSLISGKQEELSDIQGEISSYDLFSDSAIEDILNLTGTGETLNEISSKYSLIKESGTETQFQALLLELIDIELPNSIQKNLESQPLTFFPKKENIDLSVIETIAGGSYNADIEEEYKDAILTWNLKKVQTKVSVKEYSANYDLGNEMIAKIFKVDVKDLGAEETYYLFVREIEGIKFKDATISYDESGYHYKESPSGSFEFYTTEDIDVEDLPVFISPSLDELEVDLNAGAEPEKAGKKFKWGLFILVAFFVILIAFGVYLFLKKWYTEKYENYLFKNRNDLYNMVTYIHRAKQSGKKDDEISRDLKKSGWSSEQVTYVMKKYSGKKWGMIDFAKNKK